MDHEMLLTAYGLGIIDEEELIICTASSAEERNLPRTTVDLDNMTLKQCRENFRFEMDDLERLCTVLRIPDTVTLGNGIKCSGMEILRMALSRMFNYGIHYIHDQFAHLLDTLDHPWLDKNKLRECAQVIQEKGAPYDKCTGFIDGTVCAVARPSRLQRHLYNGHKRKHGLKYQAVGLPNGLIVHLAGPIVGKRHDWRMYQESNLIDQLKRKREDADWKFYIYGDHGYTSTRELIAPFRSVTNQAEADLNYVMSKLRVSVEWMFGKCCVLWAFLDFPRNQKVLLQPVGLYFRVAVLLTNAHTCLYESQTGQYFGLSAPTLEEYFY
ncbi:hypothetical protein RvY_19113 [Ramazzottius varieornatus]|uniref:DDE Tnp4 domain-containing protein n=1 Tax=Ramazzottius varieornatus TaxID=947166 RepID=A0A1D1WAJ8_RAMVA|nr:hypothetical protein RvY_19113 [Ramazzottius varieornatus]